MRFSPLTRSLFFTSLATHCLPVFLVGAWLTVDRSAESAGHLAWLAVLLGLSVLAAIWSTWLTAKHFFPGLKHLAQIAQAIGEEDYGPPRPLDDNDEINLVAKVLHRTQRRLARRMRRLQGNRQQLEIVLSGMVEGVLAADAEQKLVFANQAAVQMLDLAPTEIVGKPLLELVRHHVVHETVTAALESSQPQSSRLETLGDNRRLLSLKAVCIPGQPRPGVVIVLYDVTDLKRLENLRREFVANVSHELKTPLASIKAYAETLQLGAIDDADNNRMFVGQIEENAERLHQLILDLLRLAQLESEPHALEVRSVSVAETMQTVMPAHQQRAAVKSVRLQSEFPETLQVQANGEGLRTILDNLIGNAIAYTPAGGEVQVTWRIEHENVFLEVRDTGIGVSPRDQDRVFERFYRVDRARSRDHGGTGLGLSIVKHLAQNFGGEVGLESQVSEGSLFWVRLKSDKVKG